MPATSDSIYRELKLHISGIKDLKSLLVPEIEPEDPRMFDVDLNKKANELRSLDKKLCALLSESSLKKEWLRSEEDIAWREL
ncbi:MAG: hypothetical protein WA144_05940 [Candidatus Methanoperedens sp.]